MSLHISLVMIKGERHDIERVMHLAGWKGYRVVAETDKVENLPSFDVGLEVKVVMARKGWTIILDPEMVLADDVPRLESISRELKATVFSTVSEGSSGVYSFCAVENGRLRRRFSYWYEDGQAQESGLPLPGEAGINLKEPFEDDMMEIMRSYTGVPFDGFRRGGGFKVIAPSDMEGGVKQSMVYSADRNQRYGSQPSHGRSRLLIGTGIALFLIEVPVLLFREDILNALSGVDLRLVALLFALPALAGAFLVVRGLQY